MSAKVGLGDLKTLHESLYQRALNEHSVLLKDPAALKDYEKKVDSFLDSMYKAFSEVREIEDYEWLCDAILKWQIVFSSVLNIPRNLQVPLPPQELEPPPDLTFYSDENLEKWFNDMAFQQSLTRRRNFLLRDQSLLVNRLHSTEDDRNRDWNDTSLVFAARVLEGSFNLARQLSYKSYWRLEAVWLTEVKQAKAYYIWERRENRLSASLDQDDYFTACEEIRGMLVNPQIKESADRFDEPWMYLSDRYLTRGVFDPRKPRSEELIKNKAYRIWQTTGESNDLLNWENASTYCRMFYDNIVPAVTQNDAERALLALKAFQLSKAPENRYLIINAFEVALAIYFFDAEIVRGLWDAAKDRPRPESCTVFTAPLGSWPVERSLPHEVVGRLTIDPQAGQLVWQGAMTEAERKLLLLRFREQAEVIEDLFERSRLLHRESTL